MHALRSTLIIALASLGAVACQNPPAKVEAGSTAVAAPALAQPLVDAGAPIPTGLPAFPARGARGPDPIVGEEQPRSLLDYGYSAEMGWMRPDDALHAGNVEHAVAIVKDAPGSPRARLWLARVVGDERFALEQLAPLADAADCPACADVLRNLTLQAWPPAVRALAERVRPSAQRAAAEAIVGAMAANDEVAMARYFGRARIEVVTAGTNCDAPCVDTAVATGRDVARRLARPFDESSDEPRLSAGDELFCRRDCCELPEAMMMDHASTYLRGLCFARGTVQVVKVLLDQG